MSRNNHLIALAALATFSAPAWGQLRIVNYNVAALNGVQTALQDVFASLNADDKPGFAVAPHLFVFGEVQSGDVGPLLTRLNNAGAAFGVAYTQGTYTNSGENSTAGAQAMFYRADTLTELTADHIDIATGGGRFTDRWKLRLNAYTSPTVEFYIYSSHLKASTGSSNETERLQGAQAIRANADSLPAGSLIIYAGDYNVYSNGEPAYQHMISAGVAQAVDPLGSGGWGGSGNAIKHTQSPQDGGPLVGGGMDDRFDLHLTTSGLQDGEGLAIISGAHMYRAFGNDGNHYNQAINIGNNSYYSADIPRSNTLADNLFDASDHVPLVVEYHLPGVLSAALPGANVGRVILGAPVVLQAQVVNAAAVTAASGVGADELDYNVAVSGALGGGGSGSVLATLPATTANVGVSVDTSVVGALAGNVQVTSSSQSAQNANQNFAVTGQVLRASNASFDGASDVDAIEVEQLLQADSGVVAYDVAIHNLGFDADQATLDVDSLDGAAAPLAHLSGLQTGVGGVPAAQELRFNTTGAGNATYSFPLVFHVSDENIPGDAAATITYDITVHTRRLIGDIDGDCEISLVDLSLLLAAFGACEGEEFFDVFADLDSTGCVDVTDLSIQLSVYGEICP